MTLCPDEFEVGIFPSTYWRLVRDETQTVAKSSFNFGFAIKLYTAWVSEEAI